MGSGQRLKQAHCGPRCQISDRASLFAPAVSPYTRFRKKFWKFSNLLEFRPKFSDTFGMQLELTVFGDEAVKLTLETERWVQMEEFPKFDISTFGRFRNRARGSIMVPYKGENGYGKINLNRNGKGFVMLAHRMVAKSFLPNPDSRPYVDHVDGDRMNCRLANLRWATPSENARNNKSRRR